MAGLLATVSILSLAALAGSSSRALLTQKQRFAYQLPAGQTERYASRAGYSAWTTNAGVRAGLTSPLSTLGGGGLRGVGAALAALLAASFIAGVALTAATLLGCAPASVLAIPSAVLAVGLIGLPVAFYVMGARARGPTRPGPWAASGRGCGGGGAGR